MKLHTPLLAMLVAMVVPLSGGPTVKVTNTKDQTLTAELLAVTDSEVTVRRASDKKVFRIPVSGIAPDSLAEIKKKAENLVPTYPELDIEVFVRKRSKKAGYYRVRQTLSTLTKIRNADLQLPCAAAKGDLLLMGQDQRNTEIFGVLDHKKFDLTLQPGGSIEIETEPVITEYDSDNEGYGNVGGFKYEGYILIITGSDGSNVLYKTNDPGFREAIQGNFLVLGELAKKQKGDQMWENLKPYKNKIIR